MLLLYIIGTYIRFKELRRDENFKRNRNLFFQAASQVANQDFRRRNLAPLNTYNEYINL